MKILIDTRDMDSADQFGETLRSYVFPGDELGCYGSFEVRPGFRDIPKNTVTAKILVAAMGFDDPEIFAEVLAASTVMANGEIYVAWHWDGDGTLVFSEGGRIAVNDDCKKDYGWEWINYPDIDKGWDFLARACNL